MRIGLPVAADRPRSPIEVANQRAQGLQASSPQVGEAAQRIRGGRGPPERFRQSRGGVLPPGAERLAEISMLAHARYRSQTYTVETASDMRTTAAPRRRNSPNRIG